MLESVLELTKIVARQNRLEMLIARIARILRDTYASQPVDIGTGLFSINLFPIFYHSWRFKVTINITQVSKLYHLTGKNEEAALIGGFLITGGLGYHL